MKTRLKTDLRIVLAAAIGTALAGCTTTPERIESLESARTQVTEVESSPRAGVAATNIAEARKSLDVANRLAESGGDLADIEYHAEVAALNAQIANNKILTAQAREEIDKGQAERQAVLIKSRELETQAQAQQAREAELRAKTLEQELSDLKAKRTDRGLVLTLGDVLFATGEATLKPAAYRTVDRLAEVLKEDPGHKVVIEGHTDSVGSEDFNQQLSERRAMAVQSALMTRGVPADQMQAIGRGESMPVASNDDAGGRQQNRRVELIFGDDASGRVVSDTD